MSASDEVRKMVQENNITMNDYENRKARELFGKYIDEMSQPSLKVALSQAMLALHMTEVARDVWADEARKYSSEVVTLKEEVKRLRGILDRE